jgi:hypothetical protein
MRPGEIYLAAMRSPFTGRYDARGHFTIVPDSPMMRVEGQGVPVPDIGRVLVPLVASLVTVSVPL